VVRTRLVLPTAGLRYDFTVFHRRPSLIVVGVYPTPTARNQFHRKNIDGVEPLLK